MISLSANQPFYGIHQPCRFYSCFDVFDETDVKYLFLKRELLAMLRRAATPSGTFRCKIIKDRIRPCVPNQARVWVFVYNRNKILFCIPAVAQYVRKIL